MMTGAWLDDDDVVGLPLDCDALGEDDMAAAALLGGWLAGPCFSSFNVFFLHQLSSARHFCGRERRAHCSNQRLWAARFAISAHPGFFPL